MSFSTRRSASFANRFKKKPFLCYLATNTTGPFWPKDEDRKAIAEVLADPKFDHLNGGRKIGSAFTLG